jgi:glycosyltransferase involved in cell wall biosynthesis
MKIIQLITRTQRRGAEIFASQLAQKLQEKGHVVLVISIYRGEAKLPFYGKLETLNANPSLRGVDPKAWKRLDTLIREFQPDIVQANASDTLKYAAFSKKLYGWNAPLVYRNANTISGFLDTMAKRIVNRWLMAEVKAVVSVSEATLRDFSRIFRVKHQVAIPIGIDADVISHSLQAVDSSPISRDYLICIGGLVPEKDPMGMLELFESLSKDFPKLQLVFLGSGPLSEVLCTQIHQRGWEGKVRVIPNQENIFPLLSHAKALVLPSRIEGLPAVILEAMYCRIPVIAYEVGGIGEVIQGGGTGWLVSAGDSDVFQAAIRECLTLPETELRQITQSAKELVEEKYELNAIVAAFEAYYKELIFDA